MKTEIALERYYDHPIEAVWTAISEGGAISEWFIQADFKPEVGYPYKFRHESTVVSGEVLEVEPPTRLVYTWKVGAMPAITTVRWHLTKQGEGTHLLLEHVGFENYEDSALEMFNSSEQGWQTVIEELEQYLAKIKDGSP